MNLDHELILLTGATGLVGRFVLARLLQNGSKVAVLVRNRDGIAPAAQRIEEVLAPFENAVRLPRPRIISGDLVEAGLGVRSDDVKWLQQFHLNVIHSGASIRFVAESPEGEPYRSNVTGMANILAFLKSQNVAAFNYVSTAYVLCRQAAASPTDSVIVKEVPLTESTRGGNDYECSKINAELMLNQCNWVGRKSIIRPSIIVGSSRDGYTSSFHGFYAPLKVGVQFASTFGFDAEAGTWLRSHLGMKETDSKNFVPVDWVADAIVAIAMQPKSQGEIYHLTNPNPVDCGVIQDALLRSLEQKFSSESSPKRSISKREIASLPLQFSEQMNAYGSYFNHDPEFDSTNTQRAIPELPCPPISPEMLQKLASYALDVNFGWPRKPAAENWWEDFCGRLAALPQSSNPGTGATIDLELLGPHACESMRFAKNELGWQRVNHQSDQSPDLRILANVEYFSGCITGISDIRGLIDGGHVAITGQLRSVSLDLVSDWFQDLKLLVQ